VAITPWAAKSAPSVISISNIQAAGAHVATIFSGQSQYSVSRERSCLRLSTLTTTSFGDRAQ